MNEEKSTFYSEWVFYETPEEKNDAFKYLDLWKKFIIKRRSTQEYVQHQILDRQDIVRGKSTLGIKIEMKVTRPKQLSDLISDNVVR